jgi:CRISPR/Cas system-associated exonuclease Cas4 (RecB family)
VIKSWSPSRLSTYEECPAKAGYKFVQKLPEPPSQALDRGSAIHTEAENYILGHVKEVPKSLEKVKTTLQWLRKGYDLAQVHVEMELAVNRRWEVCDWFSGDAYARFKVDVVRSVDGAVEIIDWKTGAYRPSAKYDEQLELYCMGALTCGLGNSAKAKLIFTDTGKEYDGGVVLHRADLKAHQEKWDNRVRPMLEDVDFIPNPNPTCRWCAFAKQKGGPCLFG